MNITALAISFYMFLHAADDVFVDFVIFHAFHIGTNMSFFVAGVTLLVISLFTAFKQ